MAGRPDVSRELARFLREDVGPGDVTGALLGPRAPRVRAAVVSGGSGVAAGLGYARRVFEIGGCRAAARARDGCEVAPGDEVMSVSGPARRVLACERTALNLLSRMSGIATRTRALAAMLPEGTELYATRKTAPGLRFFDKEAVRAGGGRPHRMGLHDAVMIKDNHIAAGPPVREMVRRARAAGHRSVEVEAETAEGAVEAVLAGATTVMLDNFTPRRAAAAVRRLEALGIRGRARIEASGGITERNIRRYAAAGVDMVSSGSITSSSPGLDFSLEVRPPRGAAGGARGRAGGGRPAGGAAA